MKKLTHCTTATCSAWVTTQAQHPGSPLPLRVKKDWGPLTPSELRNSNTEATKAFHTFAHDTSLAPGLDHGEKKDESQVDHQL